MQTSQKYFKIAIRR